MLIVEDGMNDPDGMNAYLDSVPKEQEAPSVIPFKIKTAEGRVESRPDLPVITIEAGELHVIATAGERALLGSATPFYISNSMLMRPVVDDLPASHGRRTKVARLAEVTEAAMIDRLSRSAVWLKFDGRSKKLVAADPTPKIAATILSRDGEWEFPRLSGVITTPTLRADGTILSEAGYDQATQLLLLEPPAMPDIPEKPNRAEAMKALSFIDGLLNEFPFTDDASRSVALSALITPVVRGAVPVVPMHVTTAPVAGSGKSYIIDLASAMNSGERAPVMSAGKTEEEMEKRLVGALLSGQTFISIDNVNGELGGDFLCQMIERPVVSARPLGSSSRVKIESRAVCYATGNNIRPTGDMTRRVLICSLDPDMERPELRTFKGNPFEEVLANRGEYIAAALTVVRAYVVAGCPKPCAPLASFEEWSKLVRSALVWLDRADPMETMNKAREEDPITSGLRQLFMAWHDAVQSQAVTASAIANTANQRGFNQDLIHPALRDALCEIAGDGRGEIKTISLGKLLARHKNRVVNNFKMIEAGKDRTGKALWKVVKP